jgi:hypothetical protein
MSRRAIILSGIVLWCLTSSARSADDQVVARKIVDQAVKALGGAEQLAKMKSLAWKSKSKLTFGDAMADLNEDWFAKGVGKFHVDVTATINGNNVNGTVVISGDKGWIKARDKTNEVPKEAQNAIRQVFRSGRLVQLLSQLKDKPYELSPLGELKVDTTDAIGVRIIEKDRADVSVFFDKKTHLPIKIEVRAAEMEGGAEVNYEVFLSDFKDFDGIKHPTKLVLKRDGKTFLESEISDVKPQDVDDATFDKP